MNQLQLTYQFIRSHPLGSRHKLQALGNWIGWQVRSGLSRGPHVVPFVGHTRMRVSRGMHGATGSIYCGLHEFEEMALVMHFLRKDDLFVDVGANIGSYTVLASGVCGAHTIAVEPLAYTADVLAANVELNGLGGLVTLKRCAVGAFAGSVRLSSQQDCLNHVLTDEEQTAAIEVPQVTLDEVLDGLQPVLIKIDVEGYECAVLDGASRAMAAPRLAAVIIEANGSGKRYGHTDGEVFEVLRSNGFERAWYDPFRRYLSTETPAGERGGNALFIRGSNLVRQRVRHAERVMILGHDL